MKADEVNPMVELERLFDDRKRYMNTKLNLERDISSLESQLAQKEECLINCNSNLANVEDAIRNWAKKV